MISVGGAEDERLSVIGAAAASVLRTTDYHLARTEDIAAAVTVTGGERDGRSRGGRRSAVWVYSEVKSRRVLVALAIHHAWQEYLARSSRSLPDETCETLEDGRARVAAALTEVVRFHRAEERLVTQVGFGIGDIATAEKRKNPLAEQPVWPATMLGAVAEDGFAMSVGAFAGFLAPHLRAALETVTCPSPREVDRSARALSNLVFRACLADPTGPVERTVEALAAFWFERDLIRLAGSWALDLDGAERSLAATRRRGTDARAEAYARAVLIRSLLDAGTLHRRGADEGAGLTASLIALTGWETGATHGDRADLTALCDAASRQALSFRCFGDLASARSADELALVVARDGLDSTSLVARAQANLGDTLSLRGESEPGIELLRTARATRLELHETAAAQDTEAERAAWRRLTLTDGLLSAAYIRAGRVDEGLRLAEATLAERREGPLPRGFLAKARLQHAEALLAVGHPGAAREAALAVYHDPYAQSAQTGTRLAEVVLLLARIARTSGRPETTVRLLEDAPSLTPWFADRVSARLSHDARRVYGGALAEAGDHAQAAEVLGASVKRFTEQAGAADPLSVLLRIELASALLLDGSVTEAAAQADLLGDAEALPVTLAARLLLLRSRIEDPADDGLLLRVLGLQGLDSAHPLLLTARVAVAERLIARGDLGGAAEVLDLFAGAQPLGHGRTLLGPDHPLLRRALSMLDRIGVDHGWGTLPLPLALD